MPTRQTAVFIDGGYWSAVLRDEFGLARIDFGRLVEFMAGGNALLRAYYYNCMPYQGNPPTQEESERYARARRFMDALSRLPRFEIRLGKLEYRGIDATDGKQIFEQKRVDIMLGVDMVLLAAKQRIDRAAILTGDSDFIPALKVAKIEGILVHLYHGDPASVHREVWTEADDRTRIDAPVIEQIRMR
ncbi:MAG: NYN domain-containing protein [Armatimonadetes bacterium]|nr:NYN domain-containing protein [Armatimonadota bacterium]